jgi:hypothetical protein
MLLNYILLFRRDKLGLKISKMMKFQQRGVGKIPKN